MTTCEADEHIISFNHCFHVLRFLKKEVVDGIASRFETLFAGDFDTGVYPDEWSGPPEKPVSSRNFCNLFVVLIGMAAPECMFPA